ncbi:MAG: hypothetical protein M3M89_01335 [Thermoproteota archaeon]|nr:hypothetical protein [Thermoproteota archaeon]
MLLEAIEKDKFLYLYAPSLSKVGYEDNILFILDAKLGKTAEISLFATDPFTVMYVIPKTVLYSLHFYPARSGQAVLHRLVSQTGTR